MEYRIVAISDCPELASLVAQWRVAAFFNYPGGYTVEQMTALILEPPVGPEETFALLEHDQPVGTAGLVHSDLDSRPDLTPWLAGVFVEPAYRRRGYATALVRRVEVFAQAASVSVLWLCTSTAETLYARLGWERMETERKGLREVTVMRRVLQPAQTCR